MIVNEKVYQAFLAEMLKDKKIATMEHGSFRANLKIKGFGRSSSDCAIMFEYAFSAQASRLSVSASDLLNKGEEHEQGMFPCQFDTKKYPGGKPIEFTRDGRALHIKGTYYNKPFEAVITPL